MYRNFGRNLKFNLERQEKISYERCDNESVNEKAYLMLCHEKTSNNKFRH